ncbi:MAG TPA: cytidylate kinase-like family protein [Actinobacteria bacterium]|nr:cytidylate kinase-like family protein [Actinomycetota bacterium]
MAVITISRLVGSRGTLIGKEVAKRMKYDYVDRELIQEIMNQYGEVEFKNIYDKKLSIWDRYSGITNGMLDFFKKVMFSIAKSGNVVIIGRGSFVSLREYDDVLDIMIYAPMNMRIKAIMQMRNIDDPEKAEKYILHKEEVRQSFIEHTYNIKWNQIDNFDLVFNTGKLSPELVIDTIVMAGKNIESRVLGKDSLLTSEIKSDEILDNTVKSLLGR